MPQDSMFPDRQRWTAFQLDFREVLTTTGRAWNLHLRRTGHDDVARLVWQAQWRGAHLDLVSTLAHDATEAFFFGEAHDLAREASRVHQLARAHYARQDRLGF